MRTIWKHDGALRRVVVVPCIIAFLRQRAVPEAASAARATSFRRSSVDGGGTGREKSPKNRGRHGINANERGVHESMLSVPKGTWSGASGVPALHLMRAERGSFPASRSALRDL